MPTLALVKHWSTVVPRYQPYKLYLHIVSIPLTCTQTKKQKKQQQQQQQQNKQKLPTNK